MSDPLNQLADVHYGQSPNDVVDEDGEVPIYGTGGVYGYAKSSLYPGPGIVVARKGTLSSPHFVEGPFWPVDTTYAVIPKNGVDIRWLYYCLLSFDLSKLNEATGVPSISREWLRKIEFLNPGEDAQKKIGRILQAADDQIASTQTLIDKYRRIKSGLMHDLFTRGLTPDGQLRPKPEQAPDVFHETELGLLPQTWSADQIGALCETRSGGTPSRDMAKYWDGGIPWVKTGEIRYTTIFTTEESITNLGMICSAAELIPAGTVVMALFGQGPTRGRVGILGIDACLNQACLAFITNPEVNDLYLYYCLTYLYERIRRLSNDGAQQNLNSTLVKSLRIPKPLEDEQIQIAERLNVIDSKINAELDFVDKATLLKRGLMEDLLTGRVPVQV